MKKVSIITINYNNAKGLERTINSVINQTYKWIEYIIIDGKSTDDSPTIINRNSSKISWSCSGPDSGIYDAMNKGIKHATGDFLLFLNSGDSFICKHSLEKLMKKDINADLIICRQKFISTNGKVGSSPKIQEAEIDIKYFLSSTFPHQSTLIRRSLFNKIGMYDTTYKVSADWVFWVKAVIEYKCSIKTLPIFITYMEDGGVSRNIKKCHDDMSKLLNDYMNQGLICWDDIFDIAISARRQTYCNRYILTRFISKACAWIGKHI